MKFITKLTAGIVSLGLVASVVAADPAKPIKFELPQVGSAAAQPAASTTAAPAAPAAQIAPAAPVVKYTQAQLMEVYGFMLAMRMNLADLEFTPADVESMAKGIKMAITREEPPYDAKALSPQLQEFIGQKQQALMAKIRNVNAAEGTAFFAKLKAENKAVQFLPSGLGYEVIKAATGPTVKLGQVAKFHYTLSAVNGQVMESSAGREPLEGLVQVDAMIPGMVEGLQKIPVGAKYKLYVPSALAYGDQGGQGMPPAASLVFEVEMLEVKDAPLEVTPVGK